MKMPRTRLPRYENAPPLRRRSRRVWVAGSLFIGQGTIAALTVAADISAAGPDTPVAPPVSVGPLGSLDPSTLASFGLIMIMFGIVVWTAPLVGRWLALAWQVPMLLVYSASTRQPLEIVASLLEVGAGAIALFLLFLVGRMQDRRHRQRPPE